LQMIKRVISGFVVISIAILLISWGSTGHYKISNNSSLSFFQQMSQFSTWPQYLADHASDADDRKDTDPTEAPKHYIDIDMYASFNTTGHIAQTWDSIIAQNGAIWVTSEGTLPWSTLATYDSLKNAFQHYNWAKAMFFAADLGHYVADGHMPLHITKNYDGQYTGNDGIHSRYESTMIYGYNSQIVYTGDTVKLIPNVNKYVFNYIYKNHYYKDSILDADDYAYGLSSNYYSTTYKAALWNKTRNLTIMMFKNASHALAELIYNAWVEAGSPPVGSTGISESNTNYGSGIIAVYPNPVVTSANIQYTVNNAGVPVKIYLSDFSGRINSILFNGSKQAGNYDLNLSADGMASGIYFCIMESGDSRTVKKIVIL
jgi:hypothetical protein